ncbi:SusD/RagB family nutrient-binding outer membrane lipoprotein [Solitalea longa]|uniref:SusD/RagB family nutrient-binding outer membrane lipoprotein n=1 Tax=Solitalea longa TaxID=2079460 RepID=A0A2S5A3R6_9SPHI|nr:SusD/RagB family nutrient-binding outer membrane lipoprotein [Solitalea longa]POY36957.1 SusD/RagB family nutrient-binding outer membrane lipoprotein [Solitalea longa]
MKFLRINIKYSVFWICFLFLTSCTKSFLDVNTDPNNPTKVSLNKLLPTAQQHLAFSLGFTRGSEAIGLTEILSVYTHQVTVRESQDQYNATGENFSLLGAWDDIYSGSLQDLENIISQGTTESNMVYVGIAKILKAYAFSQLVDTFADVPFSEANKFLETGVIFPKYDKGQDVYPSLITLLDEGIQDLDKGGSDPGASDIMYQGSVEKWKKAANTIKLKLYTQIRLTQDVSGPVNQLLSNPSALISSTEEGLMFYYGTTISPDDRNPGYSDYPAGQKTHYQSPWFYEILKGYNETILTNNEDPRIPYYFYTQLTPTESAQNPTEYRDGSFLSIVFGSTGPNRDFSQDQSMTLFGIYPVGGRYDDGALDGDGNKVKITPTSGSGAAPYKFLTYADRLYLEAELINAGIATGDAKAKLNAAITESFKQVDYVVELANAGQTIPTLAGSAAVTSYITKVMSEYDAKSTAGKLELILTEKWIAAFGSSVDAYSDYRRTGFPVLFNPRNPAQAPGGKFQPPIDGDPDNPGAQPSIPVQQSRDYPLSLPFSQNDLNANANAPAQKSDPSKFPVFWDK